jgi:putative membrane-bound dehydrogenase-like protein
MTPPLPCPARDGRFLLLLFLPIALLAPVLSGGPGVRARGEEDSATTSTFPQVFNTQQDESTPLLPPDEALATIQVPEGFHVELFAAEPAVQQPIAMALDGRGRLWIAENYTYAESSVNFDLRLRDRIVILEDTTGDGRADKRTVFWDEGRKLTSIEIGFGGVWALCAPHLLFIPDADGDDQPDGEPIVILDGWDEDAVRHNIVNGLRWGPDGWLYGRHGILATSHVGPPGTPDHQRTKINCGIWRYHPTRDIFEDVAHGTTNPWGTDWDAHGQMFFINTVIGHLWHVVPGAHFERMYGEDLRSHLYQLLPQTADHVHWDTAERWSDVREGMSGTTDAAGGGHAHSGLMFYLGDNWPEEYRGDAFTVNLHGRRINRDRVVRHAATYTAHHAPDLFHVGDVWFRGLELVYGPDGGVYVADWADIGECHENDGVHRTSGRIYKVAHGQVDSPKSLPVHELSDESLIQLIDHPNEWYARQARRVLQERAAEGRDLSAVVQPLRQRFAGESDTVRRLRALWFLHAVEATPESWLCRQLEDPDEHIRTWSVKLLSDAGPLSETAEAALVQRAGQESSGLVQVFLASALRKLPPERRWTLGTELLQRTEYADDPYYSGMVWYGLEPAVLAAPERAAAECVQARIPSVRRFIARRLTHEYGSGPEPLERLLDELARTSSPEVQRDVLGGTAEAFRGWRHAAAPANWERHSTQWLESPDARVRALAREIAVIFGDGRAVQELLALAGQGDAPLESRRDALRSLVEARQDDVAPLLFELLGHRELAVDAVRGLAAFRADQAPTRLIRRFRQLPPDARKEALNTLVSRPAYAHHLLAAVRDGTMDRELVTPFQIRQLRGFEDPSLDRQLDQLWPELRDVTRAGAERIAEIRALLTDDVLVDADPERGRRLYERSCATCHKLFGEGGTLGPDLTGGQRSNLTYLLENIIDPSAQVAEDYRMSILVLADGRVINGVVGQRTRQTLTVATPSETLVIPLEEIEELRESKLSMMPDQLLDPLQPDEIRDLFGYLMSNVQVELPDPSE